MVLGAGTDVLYHASGDYATDLDTIWAAAPNRAGNSTPMVD